MIQDILEHATQDSESVAAALVDIDAGVSTFQARNVDAPSRVGGCGTKRDLAASCRLDAARTADAERANLFVVEIEEIFRLQNSCGKERGAGQAGFFVDGEGEL